MRHVAITGIGAVSPFGLRFADLWDGLSAGRSAIRPMTLVDPERLRFKNAAEVPGFDPLAYFDAKDAALLDRFAQFGAVAAREAVLHAGITINAELGRKTAIIMGTSGGGKGTEDEQFQQLYGNNAARVAPFTIPRTMANAATSRIALEHGITGTAYTVSTACSSASHAIGQAFWMVRSGQAELALAGGSEAPFSLGFLKAWEAMRVVAPDTCRPFSKGRKGLILGEGAAVLVLEPLQAARARGAEILAEMVGFGSSSDAGHITHPSAEGAALAMRNALEDARLLPGSVDYINAHGTGTPINDPTEAEAISEVFGDLAGAIRISSTKSMHGHALGAAGALEAAATIATLRHQWIPPTANFLEPDPEVAQYGLEFVTNQAREASLNVALSNSFAFGGLNAVLAFRKPYF